ncbi:MAG: hypothetical protein V4733_12155 [Verrucomicrobiota bacterium]
MPDSAPPPIPTAPLNDDVTRHLAGLQYPLKLSFKILALASQATVTDANGRTVLYTKQKLLKFREHVEIWTDKSQSTKLAEIKANKVIDWSARYFITDSSGQQLGSVGRRGWRSLWKAHYEVFESSPTSPEFSIHEASAWVKVLDSLLGQIPILGFFTGFLFHPSYVAARSAQHPVMKLTKQPAFFEGRFSIKKLDPNLTSREELVLFLSYLMVVLLERQRG